MISPSVTLFWENAVDEFLPNPDGPGQAIGLFAPKGFCLAGVYWFDGFNQVGIVVLNSFIGYWNDPDPDLSWWGRLWTAKPK